MGRSSEAKRDPVAVGVTSRVVATELREGAPRARLEAGHTPSIKATQSREKGAVRGHLACEPRGAVARRPPRRVDRVGPGVARGFGANPGVGVGLAGIRRILHVLEAEERGTPRGESQRNGEESGYRFGHLRDVTTAS